MALLTQDILESVSYVRSMRAKRLRITIRPEPSVTVTVPHRMSLEEARRFAASREAWIRKHLQRMAERQQQRRQETPPDLTKVDLVKAQDEIFARLKVFSKEYNLPYRGVRFRCQKTKWGSCSSKNNLNLNINIVFLPRHLQDYLILHELTHIRHKNHSAAFWAMLNRVCGGNAKTLARELKQHRVYPI